MDSVSEAHKLLKGESNQQTVKEDVYTDDTHIKCMLQIILVEGSQFLLDRVRIDNIKISDVYM